MAALSSTISTRHPARSPALAAASAGAARAVSRSCAVNQNVEPCAGRALDPDLAAHQLDELLGDRQPQAGAAVLARRRAVGLGEGLEQSRLRLPAEMPMPVSWTSKRSVASRGRLADRRDADDDFAALGELDRVADQIDQHLPQAAGVAAQRRGHVAVHERRRAPVPSACARSASRSTVPRPRRADRSRSSRSPARPASIFEKSRMSLMIRSSASALDWIVSA